MPSATSLVDSAVEENEIRATDNATLYHFNRYLNLVDGAWQPQSGADGQPIASLPGAAQYLRCERGHATWVRMSADCSTDAVR